MRKSGETQKAVYNYIKEFIAINSYPPTVREIGAALGLRSTSTVHMHISNLAEKGLIICNPSTLVPVSVGQSAVSVENFVPAAEHRVLYLAQRSAQPSSQAESKEQAAEPSAPAEQAAPESDGSASVTVDLKKILRTVWLCGAAAVFCWFLGCDLVFG